MEEVITGLSSEEAFLRLQQYGPNSIKKEEISSLRMFLAKLWGPIAWMLESILLIQFFIHKFDEALITCFLLFFNAFVGFYQEKRAKNCLALLEQKLQIKARVLRDGNWSCIDAESLVPGDIISVQMGDFVPADITIIQGSLLVDQSMISGESVPVVVDEHKNAFSGSLVKNGSAIGCVTATGKRSYFGKTLSLVGLTRTDSVMESVVLQIVKYLILFDSALVIVFSLAAILENISLYEILPFALVILIASVPVALPTAFTIMRAISALELANKGVLVTKLTAIEEAASMEILCTDKTGTLTENRLSLVELVPMSSFTREQLLMYASCAASRDSQDPFDVAIYKEFDKIDNKRFIKTLHFIPFDPENKCAEALVEIDGSVEDVVKGAPLKILSMMNGEIDHAIVEKAKALSRRGMRVIGVGKKDAHSFQYVGLCAFLDLPRSDSKQVVQALHTLGIQVKMITGDAKETAEAIACQVGIGTRSCNWQENSIHSLSDVDIFAGVFPEDKLLLVERFQKEAAVVGMTGDGVNDAPALRKANVGVAVSSASDVAKVAASLALTQPGLGGLLDAIKVGRDVYRRMLTYTLNKIIKTIHISLFLVLGFFQFDVFVTTPHLVMLLIFANDFITMSLAQDNVRPQPKPCFWNFSRLAITSFSIALIWILFSFYMFDIGKAYFALTHAALQTWVFLMLVFTGLATVYIVRTRLFFWQVAPGRALVISTFFDVLFVSLFAYFGIFMEPISMSAICSLLVAVVISFLIIDSVKATLNKVFDGRTKVFQA